MPSALLFQEVNCKPKFLTQGEKDEKGFEAAVTCPVLKSDALTSRFMMAGTGAKFKLTKYYSDIQITGNVLDNSSLNFFFFFLIFVYLTVSDLHCVTWDLPPQRLGLLALWHGGS